MKRLFQGFQCLIAITIFAAVFACNPVDTINAKPEAEKLVDRYFDLFKSEKYDEIVGLYDERFWSSLPRETWLRILRNVRRKLGSLENCNLGSWNVTNHVGTESGTHVGLEYTCKHEKYPTEVSFRIFKPALGGDAGIHSQNYNSIGFLLE